MTMTKYHSKQTIVNGIKFPSILEANRYSQLLLLLRAGEIANLKLQVEFVISQAHIDAITGKNRLLSMLRLCTDLKSKQCIVEDTKGAERRCS